MRCRNHAASQQLRCIAIKGVSWLETVVNHVCERRRDLVANDTPSRIDLERCCIHSTNSAGKLIVSFYP